MSKAVHPRNLKVILKAQRECSCDNLLLLKDPVKSAFNANIKEEKVRPSVSCSKKDHSCLSVGLASSGEAFQGSRSQIGVW